ncbi:hypothetical protein BJ508DRAFT_356832 [Ascobolus immersus RN42]|uniref:Zn(2)-C6 fungal-type domain-containing protein n=1 Tax=Ascobolus immersus RN42 TaxID=1160509 RepID=A0A3N4J2F2_ASCIM|nr:hypothetical protein BJ508DRAFT_356832 [Ascobolus immersus RN42]
MSNRTSRSIYAPSRTGKSRSTRVQKPATRSSTRSSLINMKLFPTSLSVDTKTPGRTRAKVPLESRKRNPIACEQCRSRKIKCESSTPGEPPCKQCEKTGSDCRFGDLSPKVVVPKNDLLLLKSRCEALEKCILDTSTEEQLHELRNVLQSLPMEGLTTSFDDDAGASSSSTHSGSRVHKTEFSAGNSEEERSPSDTFAYHGLENTADKLFYDRTLELVKQADISIIPDELQNTSLFPSLSPRRAIGQSASHSYIHYENYDRDGCYMMESDKAPAMVALIRIFLSTVGSILRGEQLESDEREPALIFDFNDPFAYRRMQPSGFNQNEMIRNIDMIVATLNVVLAIGAQTLAIATHASGDGVAKANAWSVLEPNTFLHSEVYGSADTEMLPVNIEPSGLYISRARCLLGNPLEAVKSLSSLQCLTLMGIYYCTVGSVAEAYQYIGTAGRMAVLCGFFDPQRLQSMSDKERNILMDLLIFERMISNLMGIPSMLPTVEEIPITTFKTAHIRLLNIAGDFTAKLSEISQARSLAGLHYINYADGAINALSSWRSQELTVFEENSGYTGVDRPVVILHIQFHQQLLLFTRPSVLSIVQQSFGATKYPVHQSAYNHLAVALTAARTIMDIVKQSTYTSFLEIQALTNAIMILSLGCLTDYSKPHDILDIQWALGFIKRFNLSHAKELCRLTEGILRVCMNSGKLPATTDIGAISAIVAVNDMLASNLPSVHIPMTSAGDMDYDAARDAATAAAAGEYEALVKCYLGVRGRGEVLFGSAKPW